MSFKDKVVLITGGGDGIGKDTAILFAKKGAKLVINDINLKKGNNTLKKLKSMGAEAIFIKRDVSNAADAEKIVKETVKAFGRIDILINNAAFTPFGRVDDTSEKDFNKAIAVNVRGAFFVSKYSIFEMKKQGRGIIVNISSVVAIKGIRERAAYAASKGAIIALTKSMAIDYIKENIRVNCICPGTTYTPSLEDRIQASKDPELTRAEMVARQPLGRLGRSDEIAHAILFTASDEVAFMNGSTIVIDGGISI